MLDAQCLRRQIIKKECHLLPFDPWQRQAAAAAAAAAMCLLSAGLKVQLGSSTQKMGEHLKVEMPSSDKKAAESCVMRKMRIYLGGNAQFWGTLCACRWSWTRVI